MINSKQINVESISYISKKLSDPKYNDYTCFVMARWDLDDGNIDYALNRIRVDLDKLISIDYEFYSFISAIFEG